MCSLNQKLWVHQTVTHQAPLYHSLFNKKKLPLRLCNTQNKCVHIYSISVTWWQQVIELILLMVQYQWCPTCWIIPERGVFLPWSWETCDRLMVICFTLQLSNCYLIHKQRLSILFELSNFYHFICLWREKENWELVLKKKNQLEFWIWSFSLSINVYRYIFKR